MAAGLDADQHWIPVGYNTHVLYPIVLTIVLIPFQREVLICERISLFHVIVFRSCIQSCQSDESLYKVTTKLSHSPCSSTKYNNALSTDEAVRLVLLLIHMM